ncbi:hemagglutinin repeat-containing protein [Cedecea sp. P7760]|uniref:hemagglutinin repeat-containing protein n=1 Tax=Cedecea sp. P7760 TaxID=2726983 RepID=UPI0015A23679|nr:hemagglutinin repeat-containing protein [Cedecea sp. P7760]NWC65553.1 hemagglutinin repeat-containing protein [Cedecea sp. P7760]
MDKHPVGLAKRLLSYLVMCLIAGQPVFPAVAATINPVTPGAQMDQAGNGVPVLNIATPNQAGISHNQFQDYNVGKEGLILNNATGQLTQTQLGGLIQNNPNLKMGQEATGIINEVIGGNRSQLQGYTEVAGKAANVMVANPYGITCNGCGFINTPNATLTTGKPQFDAAGNLLALDVSKGSITIEGQGLDASKSDALSIIARATEVNAGIHAKDLKVTVGANRVSSGGAVTPIAGEGVAPVVAVDTGALGGMYANRIHLVSSDKGVGVNLGNLNARQGDITLDANGKLVVNNSLASGNLTAQADSVVLSGEHKSGGAAQVNSRSDITLANGQLASDQNITLNGNGKLALNNGTLTAGNNIHLNAAAISSDAASEANSGGAIHASAATRMDNAGKLTAGGDVALSADQLANSGQLTANGALSVKAGNFNNSGNVQAQHNVQLELGTFNHSGQLLAGTGLTVSTGDAWIDGMLSSGGDQNVSSKNALNVGRNGQLLSNGKLALQADSFSNAGTVNGRQDVLLSSRLFNGQQGSLLASGGHLQLFAQEMQSAGQITSLGGLTFEGDRLKTLAGGQLQSQGDMLLQARDSAFLAGTQAAKGDLTVSTGTFTHAGSTRGNNVSLRAKQLETSGSLQADGTMSLSADNIVQQAGGALLAQKNLQLNGNSFTNRGSLDSDALTLAITGHIANQGDGRITARHGLTSTSETFHNEWQLAASSLDLSVHNGLTNNGSVLAEKSLSVTAPVLNNTGQLGGSSLALDTTSLDNSGLLQGGQSLTLTAADLTNRSGGKVISGSGLELSIPQLANAGLISVKQGLAIESLMLANSGNIESQAMTLNVGLQFDNLSDGVLLAEKTLQLSSANANNAGSLQGKNLTIDAGQWNNSGLATANERLTASVSGELKNSPDGKIIVGKPDSQGAIVGGQFDLTAGRVTNKGWLQSGGGLNLTVQELANAGVISAAQAAAIEGMTLGNQGRIEAQDLQLKLREKVNNFTGAVLVATRNMQLTTPELDNNGKLIADSAVVDAQNLTNTGLLQGNSTLTARGDIFNNAAGGEVLAGGTLALNARQMTNSGNVQADAATLNAGQLANSGKLLGLSILNLTATDSVSNTGKILGKDKLALSSGSLENQGTLAAADLSVESQRNVNNGLLQGEKSLRLNATSLNNLQQGKIISGSGLTLAIPELNNAGLISVEQGLVIDGANLTNGGNIEASDTNLTVDALANGGLILGNQSLRYRGNKLTNTDTGQLLSDGDIAVSASRLETAGRVQGRNITLTGGALGGENTGQILGRDALNILFDGAFNNGGRLISQNQLNLNSGLLENSGVIVAAKQIQLAGESFNNSGQVIGDNVTLHSVKGQNDGLLQGDSGLQLSVTQFGNGAAGKVLAGGGLDISGIQLSNDGVLQGQRFTLQGGDLTNAGSLSGKDALSIKTDKSVTNDGQLLSQGELQLSTGQLNNNGVLAAAKVGVQADTLNNTGTLQSNSALELHSAAATNSGTLLAKQALNLIGTSLNNSGTVQGNTLSIAAQNGLTNQATGKLLAADTFDFNGDALTNNGVVAADNARLAVNIFNNGGLIQGNNVLSLSGAEAKRPQAMFMRSFAVAQPPAVRVLNNLNGGRLLSGGKLDIAAADVNNTGSVQSHENLTFTADSLNNQGRLSAGNLTLNIARQLNNQNGGVVAANNLELNSRRIDNQGVLQGDNTLALNTPEFNNLAGGQLITGSSLSLTIPQMVNLGLISVKEALTLSGASLDNQGTLQGGSLTLNFTDNILNRNAAKLLAEKGLSAQTADLNNAGMLLGDTVEVNANTINNGGLLQGNSALKVGSVTPSALTNQKDGRVITGGQLAINADQISNAGVIQGQQLGVKAASWNNSGSALGINGLTAQVDNQLTNDGQLLSQGVSRITAGTLSNAGALLSEGNLDLTLASGLTNTGAMTANGVATVTAPVMLNQGQIVAKNLSLSGSSLNNSGDISGVEGLGLSLGGNLDVQTGGKLLTNGLLAVGANILTNLGRVQGNAITLNAAALNNQGRIEASSALNGTLRGNLDNGQNAVLLSQGTLDLSAQQLTNNGTMQGNGNTRIDLRDRGSNQGQLLSGGTLTLNAPGFTNGGWVQGFALWLNAGSLNNSGTVLAQQQGTVGGSYILNNGMLQGANLTVNPGQLDNNGTVYATQNLGITATQVNNAAVARLLSQGNMGINAGNTSLQGQVAALGNLSLNSQVSYNQLTTLAAGNTLAVSSQGDINVNGLMQGQGVHLSAAGTLNNNGQVRAGYGESHLSAGQLNLNGSGSVQAGGTLRLTSQNGINNTGFVGTAGDLIASAGGTLLNSALLYAGNNMSLFANSIRNSRGDILAGNNLWMQRDAAGNANAEVVNTSGSIETQNGDISIRTGHLLNERDGFTYSESLQNYPGSGESYLNIRAGDIDPRKLKYSYGEVCTGGGGINNNEHCRPSVALALKSQDQIKRLLSEKTVTAVAQGGAGRISSGRDAYLAVNQLENNASNILARNNMQLSGETLNNLSAVSGKTSVYQVYNTPVNTSCVKNPDTCMSGWSSIPENGSVYSVTRHYSGASEKTLFKYTLQPGVITETSGGDVTYRAVIQAGGAVVANFSNNISNTSVSANTPGYTPGRSAPGLNLAGGPGVNGGAQAADLKTGTNNNVTAPPATIDIPGNGDNPGDNGGLAVVDNRPKSSTDYGQSGGKLAEINQQNGSGIDLAGNPAGLVNGGITNNNGDTVELTKQQSGEPARNKNDDIAAATAQVMALSSGGKTPPPPGYDYRPIELTDISAITSQLTANGSPIKLSDYPLPSSNNGYFVVNKDPKSPYLIVTNPKLEGLGKLDNSLFNDLYKLAGMAAPNAPQETRATYTDTNRFLGSDYFLARLNLRPEYDYRFLGDAAFDTRYVSNQILNQTGNRYVNGVGSDLEQMQYLIDHAAQARDKLGLKLGVSLSAEQVAALDSSILWWENAVIDGQNVLVPKLYISPKDVVVNNGSMIAGNQTILNAGNIINDGSTLQGKTLLSASSQNAISNINGGAINSGGSLQLSALGDINNIGSTIAGQKVSLESVGGSIINQTLTSQWDTGGKASGRNNPVLAFSNTEVGPLASIKATDSLSLSAGKDILNTGANLSAGGDMLLKALDNISLMGNQLDERKQVGSYFEQNSAYKGSSITSGGTLSLQAGRDIAVKASSLYAEDNVGLQAGRDVNLQSAESTHSDKYTAKKKVEINESVRQQGSEIASGGNTTIIAGRDVNTQAAQVTARGDIGVGAGRDINLETATDSDYHYDEETKTKKGFLSSKTTHTINETSSTREAGTLLSGDNVTLKAGNDLLVKGSSVVGDGNVALNAGNNVDIVAATDTDTSWHFKETKKSGLMGTGGIGFTIGSSKTAHDLREQGTTQSQSISTVGSTGGNVSVNAGGMAHIGGADLVAGKDLSISGDSVLIEPGHDKRTRDEKFEQKSTGLTVALSGAVGDAINNAVETAQATKNESDGRLAALKATKTALAGGQAYLNSQQATASADPNNGVGVSISLTTQKSKSEQHMESDKVNGSSLTAGNNLNISATGKGNSTESGNILIGGSQLKAGGDTSLAASNDIVLSGAANTQLTTGKNSSSGGGVGVSIGVGSGSGGISVFANVNAANGKEKGNGTNWTETTVDSGGTVSLTSGRDAILNGAQVNGNKIRADIGRDLLISSQQDSNNYDSKQTSVAAGGSFTFGSMSGPGYISLSQDKMKSTYDSVQEQSGIFAGNGGFDITVGNHTQLNGAVIASRADADKNSLDTGTLGFADIGNQADYKVSHSGISLSGGSNMSAGSMLASNGLANVGTLLAGMNGKGHAEGTTQSAVANGNITIRDKTNQQQDVATLSRDTEHANGSIGQIFNKEEEQKRLQTAQLVSEIGGQMTSVVSTYGDIQALDAVRAKGSDYAKMSAAALRDTEAYQKAFGDYGIGGKYQMVAQSVSGILAGAAGGDFNKALADGLNPVMAQAIKGATEGHESANLMAHAVWGALAAQLSGGNAAAGAAGAFSGELAARYIAREMFPGKDPGNLTQDQKQLVSLLGTMAAGIAGGVVGNSTAAATTGAQAGKNAVENNALSAPDEKQRQDAKWSLPYIKDAGEKSKAEKLVTELNAKDKEFDTALDKACKELSSAACQGMRQELAAMGQSYDKQMDGQYIGTMGSVYKEGADKIAGQQWQYATADARAQRDADVQRIEQNWNVSPKLASIIYDAMTYIHAGAAVGGAAYGMTKAGSVLDHPNISGKVLGEYSAIKPGPLPDVRAETFSGGRYKEVLLFEDTLLYRGGTIDTPLGQFFSSDKPAGIIQTRIDKAVLPVWPSGDASPIETSFGYKIPAGTKVYIGETGSQSGFYIGGTEQIYVPTPWKIPGVEMISKDLLK